MSDQMNTEQTPQSSASPVPGSGRQARAGFNTGISILAALAILLMANYLSKRHYVRADWTASGLYTLSDKTTKALAALDRDVKLHVLWSQASARLDFLDLKEILDRYAAASSRIKLEFIDPDLHPDRMQIILDTYGAKIKQDAQGQVGIEAGVFVVAGEKVKFVASEDFEDFGGGIYGGGQDAEQQGVSRFKGEQALTSAILLVTSNKQSKVCFVQGHGEWQFEGFGGRSLGHVKEGFKQDSYKVESIATQGASRIPPGCDLVVVAGPQKAVLEEEAALLKRYVQKGGKLLLLLDPLIEGTRFVPTGFEGLVASWGIKLHNDMVFETDPRRLISQSPFTLLASDFSPHEAVKQLAISESVGAQIKEQLGAAPVVFAIARSLGLKEETEVVAEPLAKSSTASWGEVDLSGLSEADNMPTKDQYDHAGPVTLAMAVALNRADGISEGGRVIVVGDSDFLSEELFVNAGLLNRDFWSGLVGWLTEREELIAIAPKNPEHVRLNLTESDISTIWWVLGGELLIFFIAGFMVWSRRRR